MAYTWITPNANVWLLKDVPLEPDYMHTVFFKVEENETMAAARLRQKNMFVNDNYLIGDVYNPIGTLTNQMYKRVNRNTIKVNRNYNDIYMCNYMVFQNMNESKYYYAFVLELNYISEGTTEIVFQIDVMQTWVFDYRLLDCYVEREHSSTDVAGENTIPEPIDAGEYVVNSTGYFMSVETVQEPSESIINGKYSVVVAAPWDNVSVIPAPMGDGYSVTVHECGGSFYGKQFSGIAYNKFDLNDTEPDPLSGLTQAEKLCILLNPKYGSGTRLQEIVAIYIVPTAMISQPEESPSSNISIETSAIPKNYGWQYKVNNTTYTPKNKKIYTYPYTMLKVTTSDGTAKEYKYELFSDDRCRFKMKGTVGCPPQIQLIPLDYKKPKAYLIDSAENLDESLTLENFPMCSWVSDTFKAWLAQNATKIGINVASTIASSAIGAQLGIQKAALSRGSIAKVDRLGDAARATVGGASGVLDSVADIIGASFTPDDTHGVSKAMIGVSTDELGFRYYSLRIKDEYAAIVDEFFDKFGYATKRLKIPNRDVRENWCYTETKNCELKSISPYGLPSGAADEIKNIYNNGITFWKPNISHTNPLDGIGDYSLSNRPVSELSNN